MLAWKEKVADRLARLLADSPPSPAAATAAPVKAPQIVGDMLGAVFGGLLNSPLRPTEKRKYQVSHRVIAHSTCPCSKSDDGSGARNCGDSRRRFRPDNSDKLRIEEDTDA
ncbi:hypothetical protein PR202_ga25480 [Eleusine coracana subsp. coracana]|uniref:Uncharacterized protein n=1 Tax=Eleusine coracana subsp. coracana TaxID=191504 RepID=A0AAV5DBB9_ELECO|nr:hypothetical protein PR202_ga25420 [Eleusine coracana subsp. coracana]GJN07636.1 hypothetical protein PR202_ga25480 [Eleusine coracana subsp. coracana]